MKEFKIADDVLKCAKWHIANHHSKETVVDCIFYGLYESKYGESIHLAEIWADNEEIDAELAQQAKMIADELRMEGIENVNLQTV